MRLTGVGMMSMCLKIFRHLNSLINIECLIDCQPHFNLLVEACSSCLIRITVRWRIQQPTNTPTSNNRNWIIVARRRLLKGVFYIADCLIRVFKGCGNPPPLLCSVKTTLYPSSNYINHQCMMCLRIYVAVQVECNAFSFWI